MKRIVSLALVTGLFLSSCNLPNSSAPDPQIATSAALTVQAVIHVTPLASPTTAPTESVEATPIFSQPMASVGEVTNCRAGPGVNYERVTQILPNDTVEIVGFFSPNYWIVSTNLGLCWLPGEFTTPSGSIAVVPTVTAPLTPQGDIPQNVSLQKWDIFCNFQTSQANITIQWSDKDNETGYRIIRNGDLIAELPENTTQFIETISLLSGQSAGYAVVAFNASGSTSSSTITLSC